MQQHVIYVRMDLITTWKPNYVIGNARISRGLIGIIALSCARHAPRIVFNASIINLNARNAYHNISYNPILLA